MPLIMHAFFRNIRSFLMVLFILPALVACTFVPFDADRSSQTALEVDDTRIARLVNEQTGRGRDTVILAPLINGTDALGARLRLIEQAERSIDIKTFLIKPDLAGSLIWLELYAAAERGVRIRLLYDDVFTSASDAEIASLDAHPNVEIRTFNPLSRNSTTVMNFVLDFGRVNRRMHNKAMVVDGALAIIGGRNIADEYFQIKTKEDFADFDLLVGGRPVEGLSAAFDLYWNDQWAVPIASFEEGDAAPLREALEYLQQEAGSEAASVYQNAVNSTYLADLRAGRVETYRGQARTVVDDPEKLRVPPGNGPFIVGNSLYNTLLTAERDVLIVTPYFVPEPYGERVYADLVARGVRVRIITNSLAATNHPYVHGGYKPYRDRLLQTGVEFIELRSDAPLILGGSDIPVVLHTKLAVVDGTTIFAGSTNIDPRSIRQNSEIGMIIQSPGLAQDLVSDIDGAVDDYAYRVQPGTDGNPVWVYQGAGLSERYTSEPGASFWRKLLAALVQSLPLERQL